MAEKNRKVKTVVMCVAIAVSGVVGTLGLTTAGPGANFYIKTTPDSNLEVVGDEFNQGQAPYCVAISKECKYYDEINAAVKVLIKNGTTDELYAKWCE